MLSVNFESLDFVSNATAFAHQNILTSLGNMLNKPICNVDTHLRTWNMAVRGVGGVRRSGDGFHGCVWGSLHREDLVAL